MLSSILVTSGEVVVVVVVGGIVIVTGYIGGGGGGGIAQLPVKNTIEIDERTHYDIVLPLVDGRYPPTVNSYDLRDVDMRHRRMTS